jgi:prephenate dehydratase
LSTSHNVHQATLDAFASQNVTLAPQISIEDIFSAVQSNTAYRGVVPFENSSNGSVVFTLDLFADLQAKYPDILVTGEAYVSVRHCLLGYAPSSDPGANAEPKEDQVKQDTKGNPLLPNLSHIKTIYSHPQAWGQCKSFLSTHVKNTERIDVSSTSKAAEIAAKDKSGASAALSSVIAAELFHLDVLAEGINDHVGNTTRFLVIRNSSSPLLPQPPPPPAGTQPDWKSLVTFTVDHANPGALAHCLAVFETYGLNLTSINTRPSGVRNWNYIFFVEFKGKKEEGGHEGKVNRALAELDKVCRGYRWLGSWENRLEEGGDGVGE